VSKFTVIEGSGPREPEDPHAEDVRYHLRRLAVELLRALARGDDHGGRDMERGEPIVRIVPLLLAGVIWLAGWVCRKVFAER
jgi:hypothetical protein